MYTPFSPLVERSAARLWSIGRDMEARGETEKALIAYRALRSAFYSTHGLTRPGMNWIALCDEKIQTPCQTGTTGEIKTTMEFSAQDISGLKIIPLGGLGEIGLNMMLFEYGDDIIIVDCGLMFPEPHMLGMDIVIPDISYLLHRKESHPRHLPHPRP